MKGMQINFLVQKYPGVRNFEKVNNLLFPVIWIKEVRRQHPHTHLFLFNRILIKFIFLIAKSIQFAVISDEKAQLYHKAIHQKINWSFYIACGVLAFGSFLFAIGAIGFLYVSARRPPIHNRLYPKNHALNLISKQMLTRSKSNEDIVKDTSMYTKASKTEVKNRYNQSDVQNGEEAQNL